MGFPMGFEWFSDQVLQVLEAVGMYYQGWAVEGGFTRPTKEFKKKSPSDQRVQWLSLVFSWFSCCFFMVFFGF